MTASQAGMPGTEDRTRSCLDRIARHDSVLRAMITVTGESAMLRAAELDAVARRGESAGLLHGMTVTLKDVIWTEGVRTTAGSRFFEHFVPDEDAEVVRRLKSAGAVIVGKNNLHEFAYGGTTQNPFYGSCRNPWDTNRIPGGSSGGSGAAVAADYCDVSLGTDTAGSGRIPGALNGVSALRPTAGRISNRNVFACSLPFDTISPLARRVSDLARVFAVLAGHDPADPLSSERPLENFLPAIHSGVEGLRIGLPRHYFFEEAEPQFREAVMRAAAEFELQGATLVPIDLPGAEVAKDYFEKLFHSDATAYHRQRLREAPALFGSDTRERLETLGGRFSAADYADGMRWMEGWKHLLRGVFTRVDAILTPMAPVPAPTIEESRQTTTTTRRLTLFSYVWAIAQVPVLVCPCGLAEGHLPIGLSLAAPWFREDVLFRLGCAYQRVMDWHLRRAPILGA